VSRSKYPLVEFPEVRELDLPQLPVEIRDLYDELLLAISIKPDIGIEKRAPLQDCRAIEVFNDDYRLIYRICSGSKRQEWVEIITFSAHARDATDVYEIAKERLGRRTKADQRKKK
jgi:hypothetical protein